MPIGFPIKPSGSFCMTRSTKPSLHPSPFSTSPAAMQARCARLAARRFATITASICPSPRSDWLPRTSKNVPFDVELDHRDFVEAMTSRPEPADAAWCSLSIHHLQTDEKLRLMQAVHKATSAMLMIYEPTREDGETRQGYLQRFRRINRAAWTTLTNEEWMQVDHHVTTCDFPETAAGWLDLGRKAGFSQAYQLFEDPTAFYRVFRYDR
jgi:hypothetical protein